MMNVLVACEFSGVVRDAFISRGHNAISCDLIPTESPGPHIQGNVINLLDFRWDLVIAHPPCTYLANSGALRLYKGGKKENGKDIDRWLNMYDAATFFKAFFYARAPRIAVENPVMVGHAGIRKPDFTVQPWQFGHGEVKRTCFWTKRLPPLKPTNIVDGRAQRIANMAPSKDRSKLRGISYKGIAEAMADQWGSLDESKIY